MPTVVDCRHYPTSTVGAPAVDDATLALLDLPERYAERLAGLTPVERAEALARGAEKRERGGRTRGERGGSRSSEGNKSVPKIDDVRVPNAER